MANPESLPPNMMYAYDHHSNVPWNMLQYQPARKSFDQRAVVRERAYQSQKKGVKVNDFYLTKKGFYMDYELKVAKEVPASVTYVKQQPWSGEHEDLTPQEVAVVRKKIKSTYIEAIEHEQAKRPIPGVSTYKLEHSLADIQALLEKNKTKKMSVGSRRYYHEDNELLAALAPGVGTYNPHDEIQNLHKTKDDWKSMTKKHQKLNKSELLRSSKLPGAGTYTPIEQEVKTFEWISRRTKKEIKSGFGSDARFPYVRTSRIAIKEVRPAPCAYETKIQWKDKSVSPDKKQWIKMIWKGSSPRVYH